MTEVTRWARNGEANIAYRTLGEGPIDLVFLSGLTHIEVILEEPGLRRWFDRLAQISRVILVDRRGTGLSDPMPEGLTLDDEVHDVAAVLDAVQSDRAVLQAYAIGGPLAVTFAHHRPERTLALVLYATVARILHDPDGYDWAPSREARRARVEELAAGWGTGVNLDILAPSATGDARIRAWLARLERLSMTPAGMRRQFAASEDVDVRDLLPQLRIPTLVVHRTGDTLIDVRHSRYLAAHIPGARLVEVPGVDSLPMVGDTESLLGEMEEFLTGGRGRGMDRELLTVLFTDVVDATVRAAALGDAGWRDLLVEHDQCVRAAIARFGGTEVKTVGDSFLVTFAGPPSQAVRCSRAIVDSVRDLGLQIRAGMHTGECEHMGADVGGMAVHIAARVSALAAPEEVLVSGTVYGTVVGSGLDFEDRGTHVLKGVPGRWPLFALVG